MVIELRSPPEEHYPRGRLYKPLPAQARFHGSPAKYRAYIGGMGAGKTLAGAMEDILIALTHPGSTGMVCRYTYWELKTTTWATLIQCIPPEMLAGPIADSPQMMRILLRTPEPGKVSAIYGGFGEQWKKFTSLNLDWWHIDEVTEYPDDEVWRQLCARLRGGRGPRRGWATGTPNGRDWIWYRFVDRGYRGYHYVRATTRENYFLPNGYEEDLRRTNDAQWVARFLDAEFNEFVGSVFNQWDERVHVCAPFPIPDHWPRYRAIDPGMADPCACLLGTCDEAGNVYITHEYYEAGKTVTQQAEAILRMSGDAKFAWTVIDAQANERLADSGRKLMDLYREAGISNPRPSTKDIRTSVALANQLMQKDPNRVNPMTGRLGSPRLFVFEPCINLRREVGGYLYGNNGKPRDKNNHAIDAMLYLLMSRPNAAVERSERQKRKAAVDFWRSLANEQRQSLPPIGGMA